MTLTGTCLLSIKINRMVMGNYYQLCGQVGVIDKLLVEMYFIITFFVGIEKHGKGLGTRQSGLVTSCTTSCSCRIL